jgi:hypothetical protein
VIRTHIRRHGCEHGLLAALADPRISRALEAVHSNPGSSNTWGLALGPCDASGDSSNRSVILLYSISR